MLSPERSKRWDWSLFLGVALLPIVAVGLLAWRAIDNEGAAVRREMQLQLSQATAQLQRDYDATLAQLMGGHLKELEFADRVEVPRQAQEAPANDISSTSAACSKLAREFAQAGTPDERKAETIAQILQRCRSARTRHQSMLWLLAALDPRAKRPAPELSNWLQEYGSQLSTRERAATAREIAAAAWLSASERAELGALLRTSKPRDAGRLVARHKLAMRQGEETISWRDASSAGHLTLHGNNYAGLVVHSRSLARALREGWPGLPANMRAELLASGDSQEKSTVKLLENGTRLAIGWRDPQAVSRRSGQSRRVLLGMAAVACLLAFGFAALLFTRARAAQRLSALRTDFVAAVSHELRTPIASLRILSELLAEQKVDKSEEHEMHQALSKEAKRLATTVDRLLDFSRMEADKHSLSRESMQVSQLVAQAIDDFERRHGGEVSVERDLDEALRASLDGDTVTMAIDNLLENAHKYAPEGQPYGVLLRAEGEGLLIAVSDHGPGIARADQRRIFQPFERAADKLSEATEGSGIGLSLVRHVARVHGGRAGVDSMPGEGATFTIWIPRGT